MPEIVTEEGKQAFYVMSPGEEGALQGLIDQFDATLASVKEPTTEFMDTHDRTKKLLNEMKMKFVEGDFEAGLQCWHKIPANGRTELQPIRSYIDKYFQSMRNAANEAQRKADMKAIEELKKLLDDDALEFIRRARKGDEAGLNLLKYWLNEKGFVFARFVSPKREGIFSQFYTIQENIEMPIVKSDHYFLKGAPRGGIVQWETVQFFLPEVQENGIGLPPTLVM